MPYASVQDVRDLAPHVPINNDTIPSEGTVSRWIGDTERMTDATIEGIGYATPITGETSRAIMKTIVAHAVMARVMRSRPNPESDPAGFQAISDTLLKRLRDPNDPLELTDAVKTDAPRKDDVLKVSSNLRELSQASPVPFATRNMQF